MFYRITCIYVTLYIPVPFQMLYNLENPKYVFLRIYEYIQHHLPIASKPPQDTPNRISHAFSLHFTNI